MKMSDFSVDRPVTILMMVLLVVVVGIVSLNRLPLDLFPDLDLPYVAVITNYEGVGPEEIENSITRPIEERVGTVDGVKDIYSMTSPGTSLVLIELDWSVDVDFATLDMRESISLIEDFLPDESNKPMVVKFDPSQMPIMEIAISGDMGLDRLKSIGEDNFKPSLERIAGVASVDVVGGLEREIQINVNQQRMNAYGLDLDTIAGAISQANLNLSGGSINEGDKEFLLKTVGEFQSVDQIRDLEIIGPRGNKVALEDVASIEDSFKDVNQYTFLNGKESIGLSIQKQSGANTVQVANEVERELNRLEENFGQDLNLEVVMNQAEFIQDSIDNVTRNGIIGALLAMLILFLFLKNFRSTIVIGTAIPVSVMAAFVLMYFADLSLNLMTLGGIALGIGMLVDNAIVVLENIYRHRQEGMGRIEAAKKGTSEVGTAIFASTLTTAAVFLPIAYVDGFASRIFGALALTVTFALVASLLVALTLIPMLSSKLLVVKNKVADIKDELDFGPITKGYQRVLKSSLRFRYLIAASLVLGLILFGVGLSLEIIPLNAEFIPATDQGALRVNIEMPQGTNLEETLKATQEVEGYLDNIVEINSYDSRIGGGGFLGSSSESNTSRIAVNLVHLSQRDRSTVDIAEEIREEVRNIAGPQIRVNPQTDMFGGGGGMDGAPIMLHIQGPDLEVLADLSDQIANRVREVEGTRNVDTGIGEGRPEVQVNIRRGIARQLGFSEAQIANAVNNSVSGRVIGNYKEGGEEFDIRLRLDEDDVRTINRLNDLKITSPEGITVPLAQVADVEVVEGPTGIDRMSQQRLVSVSTDLYGRSLSEVESDIRKILSDLNLPDGYTIEYGGEVQEMQDSFSDLFFALIMAIVLVYMIMAAQFESLIHPFTIMFTVPLALVGALLGLAITGAPLSVPAIIGVIMLAGIVVNNAIVMVDYINIRRKKEERQEAILNAGPIRLRPIMMTTLTTVLGLLPLSLGIGDGAEAQQPMAVVVIGGLLFSTILTLIVIPVIYSILDDITSWIKGKVKRVLYKSEDGLSVK
ncbi:efflux RND transporter permease subunit [Halonatronum saccharophilum]|uniref:efflux RND transporter permease subunit n=2 Tax=Halonatronum saccharophilum TaxID=150060 RepID=UPI0004859A68|nr:efflux RND transporter permease subunit [Halonatronum saccharophilum]